MAKRALPNEVHGQPLSYRSLISTLESLDEEPVIVRIAPIADDPEQTGGVASLSGKLRHQTPGRYESEEFSVANPYPDRSPGEVGGGIFFLDEPSFQAATLSTIDGNDHFILSVTTNTLHVVIQDIDSTYP